MHRGFSLIELIITLAIVGLFSGFAYPAYREYIIRAHRSDGQAALLDLANRMERYYAENNSYQTATIGQTSAHDVLSDDKTPEGKYRLSIRFASDSAYTLQATPIGAHATEDTRCQSLTFNHLGTKGMTSGPMGAPTGSMTECWRGTS